MKLLLSLVLVTVCAPALAAPKPKVAPQVRWEYAFVEESAERFVNPRTPNSSREYGVRLFVQNRTPVFLPYGNSNRGYQEEIDHVTFLLDVFNRLGNQGWELQDVPGYRSRRHIFKRRK